MAPRDEFDRDLLHRRAAQFRDQLERWQRGELSDDQFRPLRLQNGWYIQRHAPMLRVAVPSFGAMMPSAILTEVDLPEPFGPINVTISPAFTDSETPRTSQCSPRLTPALVRDTSVSGGLLLFAA